MTDNMFSDYPSRKIGGGNPYHCCIFCERSAPQLFGHLERHESYCLYRKAKEAMISGNKSEMLDVFLDIEDREDCYVLRTELYNQLRGEASNDEKS